MIGTVAGKMPGPRARFMLVLGAAMLYATAMGAQSGSAGPDSSQAMRPASSSSVGAAACATCHQEVVKNFANNPHSRPAPMHGGKGVTCESCHGPSKQHAEGGDATLIFDPASATAKQVNEKCQACHDARHANFERSAHGKGNVSCIGCHSIHSAGAPDHLLKLAQPQLCYQCHSDVRPQFSMPFHHKVDEGLVSCTDCHNPHGAFGQNSLPSSTWQFTVCTKCHAATAGPFVYEHPVVKTEGCTACHLSHGGPNPHLLTEANVNTICLRCHMPSPNSTAGLPAVPAHIQSAKEQSCISCHSDVHGSNTNDVFLNSTQGRGGR
ncbi:MAG: DmsE family decaheme c-type cytochrome [Terracidiphilus sp.]